LVEELKTRPFIEDMAAADLGCLDDQRLWKISRGISYMIPPNQITAPIIGEDFFGKSQITIIPGIAPVDFERSLSDLVLRDFDDEAALLQDPAGSDAGQFDV
jgi:hypothetical protein